MDEMVKEAEDDEEDEDEDDEDEEWGGGLLDFMWDLYDRQELCDVLVLTEDACIGVSVCKCFLIY